jgi:phosphatidylserine decarboxylase
LGDEKEATSTINKTLNPEWNQTLDMYIVGEQSAILSAVCWDKDRFGKDYMGEFEVAMEDIFANGQAKQEVCLSAAMYKSETDVVLQPKWFPLASKRSGKKSGLVTGAVQLQFTISDPKEPSATPNDILEKFTALLGVSSPDFNDIEDDRLERLERFESGEMDEEYEDDEDKSELDENKTPEAVAKKKKRLRLQRLKKKAKEHGYEFSSGSENVAGVLFVEIQKITDLPPEKNGTSHVFVVDKFPVLSFRSHSHWLRYGSLCGHLARQENLPHSRSATQLEPRLRREARFPGSAPRDKLHLGLFCG